MSFFGGSWSVSYSFLEIFEGRVACLVAPNRPYTQVKDEEISPGICRNSSDCDELLGGRFSSELLLD